jgi:hypothetical protein
MSFIRVLVLEFKSHILILALPGIAMIKRWGRIWYYTGIAGTVGYNLMAA